jgi:RsbT co-antagonist protein rsbRD N-terminal domain
MGVKDFLSQKRSAIVQEWFDRIVKTYPANSQKFIKGQNDRFANPVGSTILRGMEGLYEELLRDMDAPKIMEHLDSVIRVQAVQDFPPSRALSFIPSLKGIIREELKGEVRETSDREELCQLETRIDGLALLAFDCYMKCREKIYEIRLGELRKRT